MRYPPSPTLLALAAMLAFTLPGCNEELRATTDTTSSDGGTPLNDSELDPDSDAFRYDTDGYEGRVVVTLHPQQAVSTDTGTGVVFAVPFPQGWLTDADSVSLHDNQGEIPIRTRAIGHWWDPDTGEPSSIRSVRVSLNARFSSRESLTLELRWGGPRDKELGTGIEAASTWIPITESGVDEAEYTTAEIMEPAVYATLPAAWLSKTTLRTRTVPVDQWSESEWFDEALLGYSRTMVNDVSDAVSEGDLVNYEPDTWADTGSVDTSSWLFDRASTLWGVYFRTGDVKWLRHAHRASQYYALNIERDNDTNPSDSSDRNFRGQFRFKDVDYPDHKYSYGLPMLLDRLVAGAPEAGPSRAEDAVRAVSDLITDGYWEGTYGDSAAYNPGLASNHLWTERHQAYAFSAHLTAWEYTGDAAYRDKLDDYVAQMVDHVANPPGGYAADGCLVHDFKHHEWNKYNDTPTPVCSPWMTALLAEPLWRYYRLTQDRRALGLLADFSESVAEHGTYIAQDESSDVGTSSGLWDARLPQYLYSSEYNGVDEGVSDPWGDWEHTCDVSGLLYRGVVAGRLLERDMSRERVVADEMMASCRTNLDNWRRPGNDSYLAQNGPEWRLTPTRKYNWWFGTTLDLPWLHDLQH
ncbi:hypothetical protein SAMN05660831_00333 [Thiohalospira halophila DSM 15071]|uniref:Uncharacterized protein n=1 Tax=Thiohalospira halophila DSM 15071 TaxID=1123397 RepID=A0A1I1NLC5_9GAMM|nr:hypothetical protein [Thiohalospira halophila]SFC98471.1 hypothetical protein SAMN05660831_00333 [Thiohalospira halophila DSM 15071]